MKSVLEAELALAEAFMVVCAEEGDEVGVERAARYMKTLTALCGVDAKVICELVDDGSDPHARAARMLAEALERVTDEVLGGDDT